jgi:hypothetical protein
MGAFREGLSGSELQFVFEGTAIDLVVLDGANAGDIDVYLDGRRVRRLTPDRAPVNGAPTLQIASSLRDTDHSVRIVVRSGSFAVDGIVVNRQPNWPVYLIPIALGALLASGLALGLRKRARS